MYSYQIYTAQNNSNERVNRAREAFGKKNLNGYVILKDGQMQLIQFEDYLPYPGATLEQSAQRHAEAIEQMDTLAEGLKSNEDAAGDSLPIEELIKGWKDEG